MDLKRAKKLDGSIYLANFGFKQKTTEIGDSDFLKSIYSIFNRLFITSCRGNRIQRNVCTPSSIDAGFFSQFCPCNLWIQIRCRTATLTNHNAIFHAPTIVNQLGQIAHDADFLPER